MSGFEVAVTPPMVLGPLRNEASRINQMVPICNGKGHTLQALSHVRHGSSLKMSANHVTKLSLLSPVQPRIPHGSAYRDVAYPVMMLSSTPR